MRRSASRTTASGVRVTPSAFAHAPPKSFTNGSSISYLTDCVAIATTVSSSAALTAANCTPLSRYSFSSACSVGRYRWATGQEVFTKTSTTAFFLPKSSSVRDRERMSVNLSLPTVSPTFGASAARAVPDASSIIMANRHESRMAGVLTGRSFAGWGRYSTRPTSVAARAPSSRSCCGTRRSRGTAPCTSFAAARRTVRR